MSADCEKCARLIAVAERLLATRDAAKVAADSGEPSGHVWDLWRVHDEVLDEAAALAEEFKAQSDE